MGRLAVKQAVGLGLVGTLFLASSTLFLGGYLIVPAVLAIWLGVSVLLAGATYVVQLITGNGGKLFFKRPDGTIHPISFLIFLPFISSRYVNLLLYRLFSKEPPVTDVDSSILVGGRIFPWDRQALNGSGVAAILDVTAELPRDSGMKNAGLDYATVPVLDAASPTVEQLVWGVDWTVRQIQAYKRVLVQCTMGHGRSATFVAGALLALGRVKEVEEAIDLMRSKRARVGLNRYQRCTLEFAWRSGLLQPGRDSASAGYNTPEQ